MLQVSSPLFDRLEALAAPAVGSALVVLVPLGAVGIWQGRRDRVLTAMLGAWMAGGVVGVLGGGSYWPHYLIELIAPAAVGSALVLARLRERTRRAILAAAVGLALAAGAAGAVAVAVDPPRSTETRLADYVRDRARPSDGFYVLYAHASLNEAVGLRTPFPYSWSLMMRVRRDAHRRLLNLLRSPRRPTWIVEWQRPSAWGLDPGGLIAETLHARYRAAVTIDGHRVLLRAERIVRPAGPHAHHDQSSSVSPSPSPRSWPWAP